MYLPKKTPSYSASGDAAMKKIKHQITSEIQEKNTELSVFTFQGFAFRPQFRERGGIYLQGPLCPRKRTNRVCYTLLSKLDEKQAECPVCKVVFPLPDAYERLREIAHLDYEGYRRFLESGDKVVKLDAPYNAIKAEIEDETRAVRVVWSQKDGRDQAIIYFVERDNNTDGDKTHMFADFEREEIRFDKSDVPAGKILAKVKAEFRNSNVTTEYKSLE